MKDQKTVKSKCADCGKEITLYSKHFKRAWCTECFGKRIGAVLRRK